MAEFPALPLWTDAYLGDTTHLTTIEHGAYLLLLMAAWRSKTCSLPDDDKMLARITRLTTAQWRRIRPILEPMFRVKSGVWASPRLMDERDAVRRQSQLQSDRSRARWLKRKNRGDAAGMPRESPHTHSMTLSGTSYLRESRTADAERPPKATRLPPDWQPSEADVDYARKRGFPDSQISDIAANFSEYWQNSNPRNAQKRDWTRAWQTWVRKETPRKPVNGSVNNPRGQPVVFGQNAAYDTATGLPPILDEAWTAGDCDVDEPDAEGARRQADLLDAPAAAVHPAAAARKGGRT